MSTSVMYQPSPTQSCTDTMLRKSSEKSTVQIDFAMVSLEESASPKIGGGNECLACMNECIIIANISPIYPAGQSITITLHITCL